GFSCCAHPILGIPLRQLGIGLRYATATATTPSPAPITLHLHQLDSGNRAENGSRRLVNLAAAAKMARVVIGDFFQHGFAEFKPAGLQQIFNVFDTMKNSDLGLCFLSVLPPDALATATGHHDLANFSFLNLVDG